MGRSGAAVMTPLAHLPAAAAARVRALFTDLDDTITTAGRVDATAFAGMFALERAGVAVVIVTGRPAGWCDHLARMWPVAGVVGENGALYYRYDAGRRAMQRRYVLDEAERAGLQARLAAVGERVLEAVPRARIASDQPFRMHDLAIDFAEDIDPPLAPAEIARVVEIFRDAGATAKVSSIHVNGWFGDYDKLGMIRRFAREQLDVDLDDRREEAPAAYIGDSPNDEPAFAFFSISVGVANVRDFADRLLHPPRYVTRFRGGRGFAELARAILRSRSAIARRT